MIFLKIFIVIIAAGLFWAGGATSHNYRRFLMPALLALSCVWFAHTWWALTMLSAMGTFCIGYGDNSFLRKCFGNGWGRGVWGLVGALALSLGLFLTGHLAWYWFIPYLVINFTLENALKDIPEFIGDPIIGTFFASIVLLVK